MTNQGDKPTGIGSTTFCETLLCWTQCNEALQGRRCILFRDFEALKQSVRYIIQNIIASDKTLGIQLRYAGQIFRNTPR